MIIAFFLLLQTPPIYAQEGYTVKEMIERLERKVDKYNDTVQKVLDEHSRRIDDNNHRISAAYTATVVIGVVAAILGFFIKVLLGMPKRRNPPDTGYSVNKPPWEYQFEKKDEKK